MDKKKFRAALEVLDNVTTKYPKSAHYIGQNMKEVCGRENMSVEVVFCVCLDDGCPCMIPTSL